MQNGFNLFNCGHPHQLAQPHLVIPTHLHFGHAGGCVTLRDGRFTPAFPHATYLFHEDEIEYAHSFHPLSRSSYLRQTVDGVRFLINKGFVWRFRGEDLALKGFTILKTPGHTPGHISVKIESEGQVALIPGALMPTRWHINVLGCTVGNDVGAKQSVDRNKSFLEQAAKENWLLLLEHDPDVAGRVIKITVIISSLHR